MGSHSVTCHPTEVRIPPLPPAEAGTRFSDPGGMQGWVELCYVKADRLGNEPATCKSQVQRPTAERGRWKCGSGKCRSGRSRSRPHGWNMQEWKIQQLKHMESRPYRNLWRSKLQSGCVWLSMVESRQLVASPTEMTGLVPRVGVIHFDVEADSNSAAQKLRVFILLLYSVFFRRRVCNAYDYYSRMLVRSPVLWTVDLMFYACFFFSFFPQLTFSNVCKPTSSKLFHMTWLYSKKKRCYADFLKVPPNKN